MLPIVCNAITPLLLLALLALPWFAKSALARGRFIGLIGAQTAAGLAATYGLMALDQAFGWWPSWGLDYSTHSAFALSLALPLVKHHHWAWGGVLIVYGLFMRQLNYHSWADMLTTGLAWAALCLPLVYGIERFIDCKTQAAQAKNPLPTKNTR